MRQMVYSVFIFIKLSEFVIIVISLNGCIEWELIPGHSFDLIHQHLRSSKNDPLVPGFLNLNSKAFSSGLQIGWLYFKIQYFDLDIEQVFHFDLITNKGFDFWLNAEVFKVIHAIVFWL